MTLYFAYGSNMSRAPMRSRCPTAREIGTATLAGHRVIITSDGYASVVPAPGAIVHGLLWRLAPRDVAALNAYESLDTGLYRVVTLPVRLAHVPAKACPALDAGWTPVRRQEHAPHEEPGARRAPGGRQLPAMVYVARTRTPGLPRPGYLEAVLAAARELELPDDYVAALARRLPSGLRTRRAPDAGEVA